MKFQLIDTDKTKILKSENLNHLFNKQTGFSATWGKTEKDDPDFSPIGPFILDIEISTKCSGVKGIGVCKFCYKSNTPDGEHMSFETFEKVMTKVHQVKTVGQIAMGIGDISGIHANPDMWKMVDWCREHFIVPNVTVNGEGVTDEVADMIAAKMGACAISVYDKNKSYDSIKKLTDRGMTQCNIHYMVANETYEGAFRLMDDRLTDPRLAKLNAIVFLSLKPKGRAKGNFTSLTQEQFATLVEYALDRNITIGFDSCGCSNFIKSVENHPKFELFKQLAEPCESTRYSAYISSTGHYFPCSFMDGETVENGGSWTEGLDVVNCNNFIKDIWMNEKTKLFREKCIGCISNGGSCPHYSI